MRNLTAKQKEVVVDNLRAFVANFGEPRIERGEYGGFYVYFPADRMNGDYMQYCYDINYLNGWLYGVVQGVRRREFTDADQMK